MLTSFSVDGPDSHHTGGTALSGTEPFRDDGHMAQPGQGGSAGGYGTQGTPSSGYDSQNTGAAGSSGMRSGEQDYGNSGASNTATGKKPSLMDKLNPKVDSDGDGKAGFMK